MSQQSNNTKMIVDELKNINKSLNIHNKIMSVLLKFALDSSTYKSKTTEDIKATANKENEILNAIHESNLWSMKYFYMVALVL